MTLVSSGDLHLKGIAPVPTRSIEFEVEGAISGDVSLEDMSNNISPSVNTPTDTNMTDFYGATQHGKGYGSNSSASYPVYLKRQTEGSTYLMPAGETTVIKFHGEFNESTRLDGNASGSPIPSFLNKRVWLYKRDKYSGGSWGSAINSWDPYNSESVYCEFDTYNYKWHIQDP